MAYDEKCKELASYFLQERPDSADAINGLAQAIQDAVEDWLSASIPPEVYHEFDKSFDELEGDERT